MWHVCELLLAIIKARGGALLGQGAIQTPADRILKMIGPLKASPACFVVCMFSAVHVKLGTMFSCSKLPWSCSNSGSCIKADTLKLAVLCMPATFLNSQKETHPYWAVSVPRYFASAP